MKNRTLGDAAAQQISSSRNVFLLGLLVISIMVIGVSLWQVDKQDRINKAYLSFTAEQRLLTRSVVTQAFEASRGSEAAFVKLRETRDRFDSILNVQKRGDTAASLPASPEALMPQVEALDHQWASIRSEVNIILAGREAVLSVSEFVPLFEGMMPQLLALSDEVAGSIVGGGAKPKQAYLATRQLMLGQRMESNISRVLAGGSSAATAADRFGRDVALFGRVLDGMLQGDPQLGVNPVKNPTAVVKLKELKSLFQSIESEVAQILESSPELFQVQSATRAIVAQGDALLKEASVLLEQYSDVNIGGFQILPGVPMDIRLAYIFGGLALVVLFVLARQQDKDTKLRLHESEQRKHKTEDQNQRNQEAILRLLDELGDLAEGDLTVQASVTEDITGAIADSVNYAIEALRDLVSTINKTSEQLASASQETRGVADRLARASEVQARQVESSSSTVMQMAKFMDDVSDKTASSSEVAEKSVCIAHEGGDRVRRTIQGMDAIREHIQETSKRIKRLGESSQEIGDIVALINDIADQTNILALNAAIQASAAGEAGRGFAVVADEVQRLAERSGNATKRIETLVKTIQADTNEAIISMEKSTTEVVNGAGLAEKAGEALEEIETVSARLAELINEISKASGQVAEMASRVSTAMAAINDITSQTSESSVMTASSINKLNLLAQELRQSVAGFRLPSQAAA
jgi:twitching motility protein PilJ